ncbi:MAG TPA: YbaB/EbfC family nucleoid-associated protein [Polyangiales bacterium]|jgi:DNA-binding YbaB/EbfC family protein|nr:YbaB/EbfC family nucleoid-associated protein [Polyangiales bacterium]
MNFRGGMGELMRQAGRVQRKVEKRREELREETFEARAGNDKVTAIANGIPELAEIRIDKTLLEEEDIEMVQDLVVAAANAALTKAREHVDAEIEKITGGLSIPGIG